MSADFYNFWIALRYDQRSHSPQTDQLVTPRYSGPLDRLLRPATIDDHLTQLIRAVEGRHAPTEWPETLERVELSMTVPTPAAECNTYEIITIMAVDVSLAELPAWLEQRREWLLDEAANLLAVLR